jgi:hypothetical protein
MIYIKQHISYALSVIVLLFANQAMAGSFYFAIEGAKVSNYESTMIRAFNPSTIGGTLGYSFESIKNLSIDTNFTSTVVALDSTVKNNKVKLSYFHLLHSVRYTYPISRKVSAVVGVGYLSYAINGSYVPTTKVGGRSLKQAPTKGSVLLAYQFAIQAKTTKQTAVFVKYNYIGTHKTATVGFDKEKRKISGLGLGPGKAGAFGSFIVGATYTF